MSHVTVGILLSALKSAKLEFSLFMHVTKINPSNVVS